MLKDHSDSTMSERSYHGPTSGTKEKQSMLDLQTLKEGNVLFNDALNTFYLRLYSVRHMVKDHSDSEKGNPLPPHRLLLSIDSKGSFIDRITHATVFVTPVVEHWLE